MYDRPTDLSAVHVQAHVLNQHIHDYVNIAHIVVRAHKVRLLFGGLGTNGIFVVECQCTGAAGTIVERELGELQEVNRHWRCPRAWLRRG